MKNDNYLIKLLYRRTLALILRIFLLKHSLLEKDDSLSVYSHRLARIGALMLEDNARFKKLVAITDGKKREFSGNTMTKKFHDIMRAIGRADSVEIFADFA